jgi:hypothetical protein
LKLSDPGIYRREMNFSKKSYIPHMTRDYDPRKKLKKKNIFLSIYPGAKRHFWIPQVSLKKTVLKIVPYKLAIKIGVLKTVLNRSLVGKVERLKGLKAVKSTFN